MKNNIVSYLIISYKIEKQFNIYITKYLKYLSIADT